MEYKISDKQIKFPDPYVDNTIRKTKENYRHILCNEHVKIG